MKKSIWLVGILLTVFLSGCGSASDSSNDAPEPNTPEPYTPEIKTLNSLTLVDATGKPLQNASVTIVSDETEEEIEDAGEIENVASLQASLISVVTTDANGQLVIDDLAPGSYTLTITVGGVTVTSTIVIQDQNADESATIAAPVVVTESDSVISLQDGEGNNTGIFASISGVIFDDEGPVSGVQIEISGGDATNGAVASDITNEEGEYTLIINVSLDKLAAMKVAKLRVIKDGYETLTVEFDPTSALAFIGKNFALEDNNGATDNLVYLENFEQLSTDAVCGSWEKQDLSYGTYGFNEGEAVAAAIAVIEEPEYMTNLWHSHEAGLDIKNAALEAGFVLLAPDDVSTGFVPNPIDQKACWYGQASGGDVGQGNFLGDLISNEVPQALSVNAVAIEEPEIIDENLDGGTSRIENGGAIVSPTIDLSNEMGPLALTFKTWWEIESVNPNENGFDLLIIETSIDGGMTWNDLARLNPLSDPESGELIRDPIPFSNRGFNRAPVWTTQEPIDISHLAEEHNVKLRFVFVTVDELFNGFRGWLLDDIKITREEGSFPHFESCDSELDECGLEELPQ
ncbi:MAG: carboxypeptidase regulatory-like domain-containing protein [Gammaproteobacteria bacterium]|nr:carboxypeptidase regulatory-like domain-containing protein [Gammaproteobacteria bacterium]